MGAGASRPRPNSCVLWYFSYSPAGIWHIFSGFRRSQRAHPTVPPWANHGHEAGAHRRPPIKPFRQFHPRPAGPAAAGLPGSPVGYVETAPSQ